MTVLGVDDFAFRRASRYGTLLMELEQRRVIDLLSECSQDVFAYWLRHHPEVRCISCDRGGDYAAAATASAPQAEQIADRFNLLVNVGEVMDYSRGYIQHWLHDEQPPEQSIRRVFRAAEALLKADRVAPSFAPNLEPPQPPLLDDSTTS